MKRIFLSSSLFLASFVGIAGFARAQSDTPYRTPSPALAAIVDAPLTPDVAISPDKQTLLLIERAPLPSIAELAQPELRLAGLRINPATHGPSRALYNTGLVLKRVADGHETRITGLPTGARIGHANWSRDSRHIAFTVRSDDGVELWVVDGAAAKATRLTGRALNNGTGVSPQWMDERALAVAFVPADRGAPPVAPRVPTGPVVQENVSGKKPARTFQDMLASPHDEALFDYYATSELAVVTLDGAVTPLGKHGIFLQDGLASSPDGRYLVVRTVHRPYSYIVLASRFPTRIEVVDRTGKLVHAVADLPLAENRPLVSTARTGPRAVGWRADAPSTLSWFEALDGGDGERPAELRDEWFTLAAPFVGAPVSMQKFALRISYNGVTWGDDDHAIISEYWWKTDRVRTWLVAPGRPEARPALLWDRSMEDNYGDPGTPVVQPNAFGWDVLHLSADHTKIFLYGTGASPEGDRPFLDEFDPATKTSRRLWRSAAPFYEEFVTFIDGSFTRVLTQRQSVHEPPNYFVRNFRSGDLAPITRFPNPFPQVANASKELIKYQRADGVPLSGTLYLPPGRKPGDGPLPTLLWVYPLDYKNADAAAQITDSPYRFIRVSPTGPLPFLLAGYAVFDNPSMPIIGDGAKEANDSYVPQLIASAQAAVDELVRRGVAERNRIAVGGHSYGGFTTVNLLAHTRLFCAGIARSGLYNHTLTPFGFQTETRTLWQAPEVYAAMFPFNFTDKVKDPLLLVHGTADNNPNTFPIQSERLYAALKGHGATTRLVLLPHESHGYRARENVLHLLWEEENWLDTHVKAPPRADATQ